MIRVLPPEVINQIAAGEVVERPFSVVKELVENSLDAGATSVRVEIEDGGRSRIRIIDDGDGFTPDDLRLAFVSHATSKLNALADLEHIASLGFRGEALASIGSISRATIRSRCPGADEGWEIRCEGGAIEDVKPAGCPQGTLIDIQELFYNTPARRRFLKTPRAERARIQDLLVRLAVPREDVEFTLIADGKEVVKLPAGQTLRERVARAFGRRLADELLPVSLERDLYRVEGLTSPPGLTRKDATQALLWINGRLAKDRGATQAVRQAYREFLMHGQQPVHFLLLALPPDEVDVNVHPTKSEVRFLEARKVCGVLHEAVKVTLREQVPDVQQAGGAIRIDKQRPAADAGFPSLGENLFRPLGRAAPKVAPTRAAAHQAADMEFESGAAEMPSVVREPDATDEESPRGTEAAAHPLQDLAEQPFLQVLDLYLVFDNGEGMVVVDQHALHERVLYERLKARHKKRGAVAVQRLLVPEVIELADADKAWLMEQRDALAEEGFLVEDFGGCAVSVQGVPAALGRVEAGAVVESLLRGDGEGDVRPRAHEAVVERFHSMACRAAVMAGDRLNQDEMRALIEEAAALDHAHTCPHGRPTTLTFRAAELERFFRRKV